ncbi:hypothetical protein F66182_2178 [Fusarium sp. NRRL 66182]|nr:hypothetical protein F66182_2178 [Fusarium sp. NRRL 66182]
MELSSLQSFPQDVGLNGRQTTHASSRTSQHDSPLLESENAFPTNTSQPIRTADVQNEVPSTESLLQIPSSRSSNVGRQPFVTKLSDPEPAKQVCSNSVFAAMGHFAWFHLPAVAISLTLFSLHVARVRWGDLTAEQLSVMQFAAKGHEILILVSLTDILLHRICYGLLMNDNGVPLGFISSPFYLGSPVLYFFSWELWAGMLRPNKKSTHQRPRITGIIIITAILLSVAAAPLSAIAMIPRSGWWQIHVQPKKAEIITYLRDDLYPTDLGSEQAELYMPDFDTRSAVDHKLRLLSPIVEDMPGVSHDGSTRQIVNITYSMYRYTSKRPISMTLDFPDIGWWIAAATSPMSSVASEFGSYWRNPPVGLLTKSERTRPNSSSIERWRQPVVVVECSTNTTGGPDSTFPFHSNLSDSEVFLSREKNAGYRELLDSSRKKKNELPKVGYRLSNLANSTNSSISADILFVSAVARYDDDGEIRQGEVEGGVTLHLCRIYSRWAEADMWVEQENSEMVNTHLDYPLYEIHDHFAKPSQSNVPIRMGKDWLTAIGALEAEDTDTLTNSTYQQIVDFCKDGGLSPSMDNCLTTVLTAYMTDILSQSGPTFGYSTGVGDIEYPSDSYPASDDTIIHWTYFLGGYGYDIKSSRTIPFALSVLLIHVIVVIAHAVTVFWLHHAWHISSWTSFGEMLILALRSRRANQLGSVGGGVANSQSWNTLASVRVINDEGRLEMVLRKAESPDRNDQVQDQESGAETDGISDGFSCVLPGVKYH